VIRSRRLDWPPASHPRRLYGDGRNSVETSCQGSLPRETGKGCERVAWGCLDENPISRETSFSKLTRALGFRGSAIGCTGNETGYMAVFCISDSDFMKAILSM